MSSQGQGEGMKQEPRAEPYQDKDQGRSSSHISGAVAPEETRNEEDGAKPKYVYHPESCRKTSCRGNQPAATVSWIVSEEQSHWNTSHSSVTIPIKTGTQQRQPQLKRTIKT